MVDARGPDGQRAALRRCRDEGSGRATHAQERRYPAPQIRVWLPAEHGSHAVLTCLRQPKKTRTPPPSSSAVRLAWVQQVRQFPDRKLRARRLPEKRFRKLPDRAGTLFKNRFWSQV